MLDLPSKIFYTESWKNLDKDARPSSICAPFINMRAHAKAFVGPFPTLVSSNFPKWYLQVETKVEVDS